MNNKNWLKEILEKYPSINFEHQCVVEISHRDDCCREKLADDLRLWCLENCNGRWRALERWTETGIRIGFEDIADAAYFRLSH